MASALAVTGFQGSWAEMEFLRRSRGIKGPFGLYDYADGCYPQYDLHKRLDTARNDEDTRKWLGDCAEYALATMNEAFVAPTVVAHWRMLVAQRDAVTKGS